MIVTRTFLGTPPFPVAAKSALADSQLRSNLAHATHTIRDEARARSSASSTDWEELRQRRADQGRRAGHMGRYLEQPEDGR